MNITDEIFFVVVVIYDIWHADATYCMDVPQCININVRRRNQRQRIYGEAMKIPR